MESLLKLWNMMDSSEQERKPFEKLTCIVGSLNQNATLTEVLSLETIEQVWNIFTIHHESIENKLFICLLSYS